MTCPFCSGQMVYVSPADIGPGHTVPAMRCAGCNVKIIVTNPSYMPKPTLADYWATVNRRKLGEQKS